MELRQLEAFAATMSAGSVSGAARLLGRSQPVISRLIQELEAEIGYALFVRSGPRVTPTEQGFLLLDEVQRGLNGLRAVRERAAEIGQGRPRPLRLITTNALAVGLLPMALARLGERHPASAQASISIRSAVSEAVVHAVLGGTAHWGASSLPLEHKGLNVHWIGQAPCVLALPADDPLARLSVVPLAKLAGRRIITMANRYRLRHRLDRGWGEAGLGERAPLIETNSSMNAQAAVRAGLGVALLEPATLLGAPLQGVTTRPVDIDVPFFFGVITPQFQPVDPVFLALNDALAEVARERLPGFVLHDPAHHDHLLRQMYDSGDADDQPDRAHDRDPSLAS
ncbi:LysR family transcriptional regulator [Bordetella genomosp. 10]|uniref:LysR family transcriptional regulator n=1 Tax=Bordetella genomosp. 10 TaxID=1416804 RepID=A0A261S9H2_9BORD|nr:LysR family transcriptional regulator [Bordetella genomosp. 10]OZI34038.1 LysR family transcriptional regulator [Bordetella genomosp. 10]